MKKAGVRKREGVRVTGVTETPFLLSGIGRDGRGKGKEEEGNRVSGAGDRVLNAVSNQPKPKSRTPDPAPTGCW